MPQEVEMDGLRERAGRVCLKLSDGRCFFSSPSDGYRFLRLPFCSVTAEEIDEGIARLASIL